VLLLRPVQPLVDVSDDGMNVIADVRALVARAVSGRETRGGGDEGGSG
jgi:hypothetical protein